MSVLTLTVAIVCGAVFAGSGLVVALAGKRAWFARWRGSEAVVVVVLVWICWALALGQLLGAVGLLRRGALLLSALATAGAAAAADRRRRQGANAAPGPAPGADSPDTQPAGAVAAGVDGPNRALVGATVALVLLVAAVWVARTVIAVHRGINDPDSLGYHLPFATTFAQTGYANQHAYVFPYLPVHFYPANDELLQAIALALTHSVAFSAVKNLIFGGFILVAAHAIGKPYRAGVSAVAAAAIVLGLPVIAFSQPGEAVNDALLILVILGGLALLAHARRDPAPYVLALGAAGVAIGTKVSAVFPAAGLGVLALVLLRSRLPAHRMRWAAAGCLAAVALGGSWYLRNTITYGNPVPPTSFHLGPFRLPQIATASGPKSKTVLGYLVRGRLLAQFRHGLVLGLGPLVVLLLALWLGGVVSAVVTHDAFRQGLGIFAAFSAFGYLVTPASAWGMIGPGAGLGAFVINLHYAAVALLAGLIAGALALARRRLAFLFPSLGIAVVATSIRPGQRIAFWSPEIGGAAFRWLLAAAAIGAAAWLVARGPRTWRGAVAVAAGAVLVAVVGVVLVARRYPSQVATDPVEKWAAHVQGAKVAAWIPDTALLYGPGSTNRVVTLTELSDQAPVPLGSCAAWMATVIAGDFNYSAVLPLTTWHRWLASDPAFKFVAEDPLAVVFQVVGRPNVNCR